MLELARIFLKLGATAFGGPAAHIALMEREFVKKRGWLTREHFLGLLGLANLVPGPNSTEVAMHIGYVRGGWRGLVIAGFGFILPAYLLVLVLSEAYLRYGKLAGTETLLRSLTPILIALFLQAFWRLAPAAFSRPRLIGIGLGAGVLAWLGVGEVPLLIAGGLLALNFRRGAGLGLFVSLAARAAAFATLPSPGRLFTVFLKIGATLYGSGYVLVSYLRTDFVLRNAWLTEAQVLDAVAIGQLTPGPVFTAATFVGYLLGGAGPATLATIGIFLPSFFFVALSAPWHEKIAREPERFRGLRTFLEGVSAVSLALLLVVTLQLGASLVGDPRALVTTVVAALLLIRFRVAPTWLFAASAALAFLV